ncbi:hypothetical protein ED236_04900 [Pseudomethylobacillus aquaticus]|uniref:PhoD-like phosphatase metallophosphatase domain-containing protein n=1 Tax=Pseudomethylobacillus aquaticus TaxID=2676064 RepID=A0A3N0V363_9PROT|nr:alkaline phosphatase D family protein [Pseudomethylobacillus aquaticus]ROH87032.1 hypothetical protein ED236_04900 [Pseudomethylobacillus aquaticus]
MMMVYRMAAAPGTLYLWVGLFNVPQPAMPVASTSSAPVNVSIHSPLRAIRDGIADNDQHPLNHRVVFKLTGLANDQDAEITIRSGTDLQTLRCRSLPAQVPWAMDGSFNILLCSCYSQPDDGTGLLSKIVSAPHLRPDLTLMMGDQIYGDLPLFEDLPTDTPGLARKLGRKYLNNWRPMQQGESGSGLSSVLSKAPSLCVADDHEYWNNYPYRQYQLPKTYTAKGRAQWRAVAQALYQDYQLIDPALPIDPEMDKVVFHNTALQVDPARPTLDVVHRLDIDPLKLLVVDLRSDRDPGYWQKDFPVSAPHAQPFDSLVSPKVMAEMRRWADDLLLAKQNRQPAFGLFSSGQAFLIPPAEEKDREKVDAEMANYRQFNEQIMPIFEQLAAADIPVVYITGDVHWGRLAQARQSGSSHTTLHEVISSPSFVIHVAATDSFKLIGNSVRRLFGQSDPWPRHPSVPQPPGKVGRLTLPQFDPEHGSGLRQRGDQIAMLSFRRAGAGIDFDVTYHAVTDNRKLPPQQYSQTFSLRVL